MNGVSTVSRRDRNKTRGGEVGKQLFSVGVSPRYANDRDHHQICRSLISDNTSLSDDNNNQMIAPCWAQSLSSPFSFGRLFLPLPLFKKRHNFPLCNELPKVVLPTAKSVQYSLSLQHRSNYIRFLYTRFVPLLS